MNNPNLYEILQVNKNATDKDIKKAYYRLAKEYHPDKQGGNTDKFKTINEAHRILINPELRKHYDETGEAKPMHTMYEAARHRLIVYFDSTIENIFYFKQVDLIKALKEVIDRNLKSINSEIEKIDKERKKWQDIKKRTGKPKKSKLDSYVYIIARIDQKLKGFDIQDKGLKGEIEIEKTVRELIDGFSYKYDKVDGGILPDIHSAMTEPGPSAYKFKI